MSVAHGQRLAGVGGKDRGLGLLTPAVDEHVELDLRQSLQRGQTGEVELNGRGHRSSHSFEVIAAPQDDLRPGLGFGEGHGDPIWSGHLDRTHRGLRPVHRHRKCVTAPAHRRDPAVGQHGALRELRGTVIWPCQRHPPLASRGGDEHVEAEQALGRDHRVGQYKRQSDVVVGDVCGHLTSGQILAVVPLHGKVLGLLTAEQAHAEFALLGVAGIDALQVRVAGDREPIGCPGDGLHLADDRLRLAPDVEVVGVAGLAEER